MGYDMCWVKPALTPEQQERKVKASEALLKAIAERDAAHEEAGITGWIDDDHQRIVEVAKREVEAADVDWFMLYSWRPTAVFDLLGQAGVLHTRMYPPSFPICDEFGLDVVPDSESSTLTNNEKAYLAALDEVRAATIDVPGIPAHKFSTNDGWLVTPRECTSAYELWEARKNAVSGSAEAFEVADRFMAWVREAAVHGGFRVW